MWHASPPRAASSTVQVLTLHEDGNAEEETQGLAASIHVAHEHVQDVPGKRSAKPRRAASPPRTRPAPLSHQKAGATLAPGQAAGLAADGALDGSPLVLERGVRLEAEESDATKVTCHTMTKAPGGGPTVTEVAEAGWRWRAGGDAWDSRGEGQMAEQPGSYSMQMSCPSLLPSPNALHQMSVTKSTRTPHHPGAADEDTEPYEEEPSRKGEAQTEANLLAIGGSRLMSGAAAQSCEGRSLRNTCSCACLTSPRERERENWPQALYERATAALLSAAPEELGVLRPSSATKRGALSRTQSMPVLRNPNSCNPNEAAGGGLASRRLREAIGAARGGISTACNSVDNTIVDGRHRVPAPLPKGGGARRGDRNIAKKLPPLAAGLCQFGKFDATEPERMNPCED